eukprot:5127741-Alexandrium_andersonii.AAC.1
MPPRAAPRRARTPRGRASSIRGGPRRAPPWERGGCQQRRPTLAQAERRASRWPKGPTRGRAPPVGGGRAWRAQGDSPGHAASHTPRQW